MDKKRIIVITLGSIVGLALLSLLVLWIAVKIRERKVLYPALEGERDGQASTGSVSEGMPTFPLKWGSGSSRSIDQAAAKKYVKNLQAMCNHWVRSGLVKDGVWGNNTEAAIRQLKDVTVRPRKGVAHSYYLQPFRNCIATVQSPVSAQSQVQVYVSRYNEMIKWHNQYVNKYTAL